MKTHWPLWLLILPLAISSLPLANGQTPFLGEIKFVGFNFAPTGWAFCDGQTLPINEYTALFSLLGTTFGGNGTTNFMLPNMQGRVPLAMGQGSGLSARVIGHTGGQEQNLLTGIEGSDFFADAWASRSFTLPTMPPFLTLNCIIALEGIFPSQNVVQPGSENSYRENSYQGRPEAGFQNSKPKEIAGVNDPRLADLLIETVKALQTELRTQQAEIQRLKNQIKQVKAIPAGQ